MDSSVTAVAPPLQLRGTSVTSPLQLSFQLPLQPVALLCRSGAARLQLRSFPLQFLFKAPLPARSREHFCHSRGLQMMVEPRPKSIILTSACRKLFKNECDVKRTQSPCVLNSPSETLHVLQDLEKASTIVTVDRAPPVMRCVCVCQAEAPNESSGFPFLSCAAPPRRKQTPFNPKLAEHKSKPRLLVTTSARLYMLTTAAKLHTFRHASSELPISFRHCNAQNLLVGPS